MDVVHLRPGPTAYARLREKARAHGLGAAEVVTFAAPRPAAVPHADEWAEELWNDHGTAVYSLALVLLCDETAALRAVALAMVDFARWDVGMPASRVRRNLARRVHRRCTDLAGEAPLPVGLPPLMDWLSRQARLQRASVALCVFGGHTYRDAAEVLGVAPEVVAQLLTSSLHDLRASSPQVAD